MPLQNRVDPFGEIHAAEARGTFTGNRGVIHDPATRTLLRRRWTTRAWIICNCAWKDVRRDPMGRNGPNGSAGWTELFFLDEVTALAAGHRPCFTCRRTAAKSYAACCGRAFGRAHVRAPEMDERLHRQRRASAPGQAMVPADPGSLPDGTMLLAGGQPHALRYGMLLRWTFDGYDRAAAAGSFDPATLFLITPATSVAVLREGYEPAWHPSAARIAA